ncbi:MAG: hypothetical protein MZV70_00330 [Desulfobacterales bacterium]|nr:hypothetical protein [Desulfobacterales bacterium]
MLGYTNAIGMADRQHRQRRGRRDDPAPCGRGAKPTYTWYQANVVFDMLSDRWAGYVREGGTIVEYPARTGRRASADRADATWVALAGAERVPATTELLADARTFGPAATAVRGNESGSADLLGRAEGFGALGAGVGDGGRGRGRGRPGSRTTAWCPRTPSPGRCWWSSGGATSRTRGRRWAGWCGWRAPWPACPCAGTWWRTTWCCWSVRKELLESRPGRRHAGAGGAGGGTVGAECRRGGECGGRAVGAGGQGLRSG